MNFFLKRYEIQGHKIDPEKITIRRSLRLNTLKSSPEKILSRLKKKSISLEKIPFLSHGYWFDADFSLSSSPEYLQGLFYIQEAASQLPVMVLNPTKDDLVLDMCAAPGSKTTQLAQHLKNSGKIIALDSNISRTMPLKNNLERCGVKNCILYHKDSLYVNDLNLEFDKILLDAPCSGNFTMNSTWFEKVTLENIALMAKTQKKLLRAAVAILKPKGTLVYSTCSLEVEEDEEIVEWAIDNLGLKLVSTGLEIGSKGSTPRTELCRKLWPDKDQTQGFFIAKLVLED